MPGGVAGPGCRVLSDKSPETVLGEGWVSCLLPNPHHTLPSFQGAPTKPVHSPSFSRPRFWLQLRFSGLRPRSEVWPLRMWRTPLSPSWTLTGLGPREPLSALHTPLPFAPFLAQHCWPRLPALLRKEVPYRLLFPGCWDLAQACSAGLQVGLTLSWVSFLTEV